MLHDTNLLSLLLLVHDALLLHDTLSHDIG
jgi:hypothetical protein